MTRLFAPALKPLDSLPKNRIMRFPRLHNRILSCLLLLWFAIAGTPALASCQQEKTQSAAASCCEMENRACVCEPPNASTAKIGDSGTVASCPCTLKSAPTQPYHAVELPRYGVEYATLDTLPVFHLSEPTDAPLTVDRRVAALRSFAFSPSPPRAPPFVG